MGSPKALLTFRGEPFLGRVIGAMREGGCDSVIVVTGPADDPAASRIAELAAELGAATVVNPVVGSQQIDSLRLAVRALPAETTMMLMSPVDSPDCPPAIVARVVDAVRQGAAIAVPSHEGRRGHPVAIAARVLPELVEEDLPEGLRTVIRRHPDDLVDVVCEDPRVLLDVDTPEDYGRLAAGRS